MRLTKAQVAKLPPMVRHQVEAKLAAMAAAPRRKKYGNVKTTVDGIVFDSKAEASYYGALNLAKRAGKVASFERQVSYRLPCGVEYRADFVVVLTGDDRRHVQDVKGVETDAFKLKRRMLKGCPCLPGGPIIIEVIR